MKTLLGMTLALALASLATAAPQFGSSEQTSANSSERTTRPKKQKKPKTGAHNGQAVGQPAN